MPQPTVAVAMSGGVDSSVAACLLREQGYRVIGLTMVPVPEMHRVVADAGRVARSLGIEHVVVECGEIFQEQVIEDFCREYRSGKTPNPCIRCNDTVKFGFLLDHALRLGADFFATGHYAMIQRSCSGGPFRLLPGKDRRKDQSYFLYRLDQKRLRHIIMPLGSLTKKEVKRLAHERGIPVPLDRESQDICFLVGRDYAELVQGLFPDSARPGPFLTAEGTVIGTHRGLIHYTVGQRRGIGIAGRDPLYVLALDSSRNAVVVGPRDRLYQDMLIARDVHWVSGEVPPQPMRVIARIRYLHKAAPAVVMPLEGMRVAVRFDDPQMSITPGQSAVFYNPEDSSVLGGGIIEQSRHDL